MLGGYSRPHPLAPAELPVGIITAFFGGPFFLFSLYRDGAKKLAL